MTDRNFFRMMGVLQLLIGFINFYVAGQSWSQLSTLNLAVGAICAMAGVFCTIVGVKMFESR